VLSCGPQGQPEIGRVVSSQFLILKNGSVSTVEILNTTLKDPSVVSCVADRVRSIQFPRSLHIRDDEIRFLVHAPRDEKYDFNPR